MNGRLNRLDEVEPGAGAPVEVADLIAEAVGACPAVAGRHGGRFGRTTTYLPGRRVAGVAVSAEEIVVGVVGCYPISVTEVASQVRAAVSALVPGVAVTVHVEDVLLPEERTDPTPATRPHGAPPSVQHLLATPPAPPEKEPSS